MSSLISSRSALRHLSAATRPVTTFSIKSHSRSMSTMHDNDPEVLETEKRRNLSKQQHKTSTPHTTAPGWNEHLASASEASVKADRSGPMTSQELQKHTVQYVKARYSPDDSTTPTTAYYSRDEVTGPLKTAAGQEDPHQLSQTVIKKVTKETTKVVEEDSPKGYS